MKMSEPSVKKNYILRMMYEVLILFIPFVTAPYVSRVLGPEGVGINSYTSSIMAMFVLFAALGTTSYGSREIARHRDDRSESSRLFWEIELLTVATSMICLVLWIVFIFAQREYRWYYVALIPTLLGTMFDISWYFTGHEQIKYIVLRNTVCKLAGLVLLFTLVKRKEDLLTYMWINSLITMLGSISMWTYLPQMLVKVDFRTLHFRHHLKETLVYFIPTIATSVYTILDKTLIGLITHSSYENGYYEQANKIIHIAKSVVFAAVNAVMGARISYLFAKERYEEIRRRISRSMDFIMLLGTGCVFGIIGVSKEFVPVFFGKGYENVIPVLNMMAPLVMIIGISNCLGGQYFTPSGQRARSAKVIILGSLVNLLLNLILIPGFGAQGAAAASLAAECTISVLYVKMADSYMTVSILWNCLWKRVIAGSIMFFVLRLTAHIYAAGLVISLTLQILSGGCVYLAVLVILRDKMLLELIRTAGIVLRRKHKKTGENI